MTVTFMAISTVNDHEMLLIFVGLVNLEHGIIIPNNCKTHIIAIRMSIVQ